MKGKRSLKIQNPQRFCLILYSLALVCFLIIADNRAFLQRKFEETAQINSFLVRQDSANHQVYQHIVYNQLVEEEKRAASTLRQEKTTSKHTDRDRMKGAGDKEGPAEIFFPADEFEQRPNQQGTRKPSLPDQDIAAQEKKKKPQQLLDQEAIRKLSKNLTSMFTDKIHNIDQEDLNYMLKRGLIDESQAIIIFDVLMNRQNDKSKTYTLQNDFLILGVVPLVYSLHLCFLVLAFAISMMHKHFSLRISIFVFIIFKLLEIMFFYLFALYLQKQECYLFSAAVHIIFDLTIYNLLLDILTFLEFKAEEFEFNIYTEGTQENLQGKIVFNITLLAISYVSCIQFQQVLVSFFFFWYLGYLVFRLSVLFRESMPPILQPFPYFALSCGSLVLLVVTLIFEETTFRPPFTVVIYGSANPDFSFLSYISCLVVFEISVYLYSFTLFYGLGSEATTMSHAGMISLRRQKMKPYYEAVLLDGSPTCMGNHPFSALVWITLYAINVAFICIGFYKNCWIFTISGMYGIYETTWEFAKLYPNWFERKVILVSYHIVFITNFLMNFAPDELSYKMYPLTKNSTYFYSALHYTFRLLALIILLLVANQDQHTPYSHNKSQSSSQQENDQGGSTNEANGSKNVSASTTSQSKKKQSSKKPPVSSVNSNAPTSKESFAQGKSQNISQDSLFQIPTKKVNTMQSILQTVEVLIEITLGVYMQFSLSAVFSEQEPNLLFSVLQPIITSFFVLKNMYIHQQNNKAQQHPISKEQHQQQPSSFLNLPSITITTQQETTYNLVIGLYLFFVGFRLSLISTHVLTIFVVSGLLMVMSIVCVFESDHLYRAETQVALLWMFFSHACLLKANCYFFLGLMCLLTILNRVEKRYNNNIRKNKSLPLIIFILFGLCFVFIKDNFRFQTFFYIADEVMEQIIPPNGQALIRSYYNETIIPFEKHEALVFIEEMKSLIQ